MRHREIMKGLWVSLVEIVGEFVNYYDSWWISTLRVFELGYKWLASGIFCTLMRLLTTYEVNIFLLGFFLSAKLKSSKPKL